MIVGIDGGIIMAHWIVEDKGFGGNFYRCSNCGDVWNDLFGDREKEYCRCCGATMDEEPDFGEYVEDKKKPRTNGDRVREMDNEGLINFLVSDVWCNGHCGLDKTCRGCITEFLNKEVEE